jgi:hypothetical protein
MLSVSSLFLFSPMPNDERGIAKIDCYIWKPFAGIAMYGGCGTAGNRMRWACGLVLLMAVGGLWAYSVIERMKCVLCDKVNAGTANCRKLPNGLFYSYDKSQVGTQLISCHA